MSNIEKPIEEKKLNLFQRIKAKTSRKNRVQGQGATIVAVACETVYVSGAVDNHPKLQLVCHLGAIIFGAIAGTKAIKVGSEKVDYNERND